MWCRDLARRVGGDQLERASLTLHPQRRTTYRYTTYRYHRVPLSPRTVTRQVLMINFPQLGANAAGAVLKLVFREAKIHDAVVRQNPRNRRVTARNRHWGLMASCVGVGVTDRSIRGRARRAAANARVASHSRTWPSWYVGFLDVIIRTTVTAVSAVPIAVWGCPDVDHPDWFSSSSMSVRASSWTAPRATCRSTPC